MSPPIRLKGIQPSTLRAALAIADQQAFTVVRSYGRRLGFTAEFETFSPRGSTDPKYFAQCADYLIARGLCERLHKNCIRVPFGFL